jgi:type IV pilus assembly protein PilB
MSDLQSIEQLLGKKKSTTSSVRGSTETVEEKFKKKMGKIAEQEEEVQTMRLAAQSGIPHIDLEKFPVSQQALKLIPREDAERLQLVCFFVQSDEIRIGALDPTMADVKDFVKELEIKTGGHIAVYIVSMNSYKRIIKLYDTLPNIKPITKDIEVKPEDLERLQADVNDFHSLQALVLKTSTTDLVTFLMAAALKLQASDVHVEAEAEKVVARFRLDGILQDAADIPKESYKQLISRIKLISGLKINITDKPQDGRFTVKLPKGTVDIRVSTLPTVYGESVVMRLLDQTRKGLTLESLGFRGRPFELLKAQMARPNGMIITTGPTGSGKTTTLYAIMQILNEPGVKIITLEDPVEYKMEGINQSQIDRSKDYTFAKGLKSILRQDPDIAMVGEIRELETADIAIQAALTGHLILSTIHTNSAAGAVPRFLSMGVKPFLLAPAMNAIIGQRLLRKLCECKIPRELTKEEAERVVKIVETMPEQEKTAFNARGTIQYFGSKGCEKCNNSGYKGRIGIYEILEVEKGVEAMILQGQVSEYDIEQYAIGRGMITMVQDGVLKSADGLTSIDEVFRVIE